MNIEDSNAGKRVSEIFLRVKSEFKGLKDTRVIMVRRNLRGATMNARPIFRLRGCIPCIDIYQVIISEYSRDSQRLQVNSLPTDVLTGWIAHELGHIMDYLGRPPVEMFLFGLRYLTRDVFRRDAEYRADQYAIRYGFHEEIIAAKKFILKHDLLSTAYKNKINRYYMPVEEVRWYTENPQLLKNIIPTPNPGDSEKHPFSQHS